MPRSTERYPSFLNRNLTIRSIRFIKQPIDINRDDPHNNLHVKYPRPRIHRDTALAALSSILAVSKHPLHFQEENSTCMYPLADERRDTLPCLDLLPRA